MRNKEVPPDDLRCHRSDGKQWRCSRWVMEGKKMCQLHHLQLSLRQHKHRVPESLKLIRGKNKTITEEAGSTGGIKAPKGSELKKNIKRKRGIEESEALDEVVKKMKLKRGDIRLELIRMVLRREAIKEKKKRKKNNREKRLKKEEEKESNQIHRDGFDDSDEENFRVLPNGVMAISPASTVDPYPSPSCDTKVGVETDAVNRRRFRSKNIDPMPLGSVHALPYGKDLMHLMKRKKRCHWCGRKNLETSITSSSCHKHFFCTECAEGRNWISQLDRREGVLMDCPVCRRICSCRRCSVAKFEDTQCKDFLREKDKLNEVLHLHYLVCILLPVLKQLNVDQKLETEGMGKRQGSDCPKLCELKNQTTEKGHVKEFLCNCKVSCDDFREGCASCSCSLCFHCSHNLYRETLLQNLPGCGAKWMNETKASLASKQKERGHEDMHIHSYKSVTNGQACEENAPVSCPPKEKGCGNRVDVLRLELPVSLTKKLEISAEEIVSSYELPETVDTSSSCLICHAADNQEAAQRENSMDNFLFRPTIEDFDNDNLEHFQKHWTQGHPVTVRNVLQSGTDVSWDPIALFCSYLTNGMKESQNDVRKAGSCLDWFEVEIGMNQSFVGSFGGVTKNNTCHEKLKLKGWLSSELFQEQFPKHHSQIINILPIPHYMDVKSGLLNLATYWPEELPRLELGPDVHISYDSANGLVGSDCRIKLCLDFCDAVNILVHATDTGASTRHICRIRKLMKLRNAREQKQAIGKTCTQATENWMETQTLPSYVERLEVELDTGSEDEKREYYQTAKDRTENGGFSVEQGELCNHFEKQGLAESYGVQWDVFRRQDVPKLLEYLRKYAYELDSSNCIRKHESHLLLQQHFYLDKSHKQRLKEEFEIEPWTFEQNVGEAVIVPAGCPYQMKKTKSCVNVVLNFLSPESVSACIMGTDESLLFLGVPNAGIDELEVKKMTIHSVSAAVKKIRELTGAERTLSA